ncbi:MAG: radical SAM protein, partial [Candidatus Omnitrophica bacterium]|nr:radical SAM protein [Candidatus Omnitrophota bacterium]
MQNSSLNKKYGFSSENSKIFPLMIVVEITNVCNLECIHCPYSFISKDKNYRPRHMEMETYKKIADEVSEHPGSIFRLLCDGEPFCHPNFIDMLKYAKSKNISPINFITNGLLLDNAMARSILDSKVEVVEISLDAINKDTYDKIRKGSNFDTVMNNVHEFIKLRDSIGSKTKIFVSIIQQPESENEYDSFVDYWTPKVDKVISRPLTSIGGLVNIPRKNVPTSDNRWPCPQLWRRLFINVDGSAEFCVEDWDNKTIVGNIIDSSITEIWQGKEYTDLRELHLAGNFDAIPYCFKCQDWQ